MGDKRTTATLVVLAGQMLLGCRHVPAPEAGVSSFRIVEQPPDRTPPAKSSGEAAEPTSLSQYREASVQEKSVVLPVYPARALAAKAGGAQVGVRVVVDAGGQVTDVRPSMLAVTITPPGFAEEFRAAVETAVRQWWFHPARVQHLEIVTEKGFTYSRVTHSEAVEAEFDLSFTFTPSGQVEAK